MNATAPSAWRASSNPRAQVAARRTFGFNGDHGGILSSPAASQVVYTILSNSEVQAPWVERKIE